VSAVYCWSTDEEHYEGECASIAEALGESDDGHEFPTVWVGIRMQPTSPEAYFDAAFVRAWLCDVGERDDYCPDCDWSEDWDRSTREQREELATAIRATMAEWLTRHDLRPRFFAIRDAHKYELSVSPDRRRVLAKRVRRNGVSSVTIEVDFVWQEGDVEE
jgi:hypothetical protein